MSKSKFITWEVTGENVQHGIPVGYTVELSPSPDFHPIVKTSTTFEEVSNVASRFSYSLDDQESWIGYPSGEDGLIFKQDYHMRYELRPSDLSYVFILRNNILYKYSSDLRYLIERYNLSSISPFLTLVPERLLLNDKNDNVYIFGDIVSRNQKRVFGFSTNPLIKPQRSIVLDKDVKVAIDGLRQSYYEFGENQVYLRDFEGNLLYSFHVGFTSEFLESSSSSESNVVGSTSSSYDGLELEDVEYSLVFEPDGFNQDGLNVIGEPTVYGTPEQGYINDVSTQVFDGSSYYQFNNITELSNVSGNVSVTVMFWVFIDATSSVTNYMFYGGTSSSNRAWVALINNQLYFDFSGTTLIIVNPPPPKWVHYAMTYNADDDYIRAYIDGDFQGSTAKSSINANFTKMTIGANDNGYAPITGGMNDIKIINRALSDEEISAYYYQSSKIYSNYPSLTEEESVDKTKILFDLRMTESGYIDRSVIRSEITSDIANQPDFEELFQTRAFRTVDHYLHFSKQIFWPLRQNSRTIMCWVYPLCEISIGSIREWAYASRDFVLYSVNGRFYFKNGANSSIDSGIYIGREWTHLVGVHDKSTNTAYFYVNGQLVNSISSSANINSGDDLVIGNRQSGGNGDAAIQDVKLLSYAVSAQEVENYYNETVSAITANPSSLTTQTSISIENLIVDLQFSSSGYMDRSPTRLPATNTTNLPDYFDGYAVFSQNKYLTMNPCILYKINETKPKTIMGWIKQTSVTTSSQIIMTLGDRLSAYVINIHIIDGSNIYVYSNSGEDLTSTTDIGTNWTHFALTYEEGTDTAKLYINGELEATDTWPSLNLRTYYFSIGTNYSASGTSYYVNASLNDIKIFAETLTAQNISDYYIETAGDYL